jgi:hypothetical protein
MLAARRHGVLCEARRCGRRDLLLLDARHANRRLRRRRQGPRDEPRGDRGGRRHRDGRDLDGPPCRNRQRAGPGHAGRVVAVRDRAARAAAWPDASLLRFRRTPAAERADQHERRDEHDRRPLPVAREPPPCPDVDTPLSRQPHGDPPPRRLAAPCDGSCDCAPPAQPSTWRFPSSATRTGSSWTRRSRPRDA